MDNGTYEIRATANDVGQSLDADIIVIIEGMSTFCINLIVSAVPWFLCSRIVLTQSVQYEFECPARFS